jgi:hypothetical protein
MIGEQHFFSTVGGAVHAYVTEHGVEWRDWEEDQDADDAARSQQPRA